MNNPFAGIPEPIAVGLAIIISILQFTIKAIALWRSAQSKQRNWFIALFIIIPLNDLGIIELLYLFKFAKKRLTIEEVKSWFSRSKN